MMNAQPNSRTRLRVLSFTLARWLLLAFIVLSVGTFIIGALRFPAHVARYAQEVSQNDWTPETIQAALAQLGLPPTGYAWFNFARDVWAFLVFTTVGLIIFWRKSDDWFGLYVTFAFIVLGQGGSWLPLTLEGVFPGLSVLRYLKDLEGALGWQLFFILLYVFPNGHFVPRWTRWLLLIWLGLQFIPGVFQNTLGYLVVVPLVLIAIGSQVYRYFWRSDPVQRQQTKWVVSVVGSLLTMFPFMIILLPDLQTYFGQASGTALLLTMLILAVLNGLLSLFPIAIAIAILRYRLWDIDLIIRRTLQYSLLSGLLALTYFGLIVVLQSVFTAASGQSSPVALVLSTLAIAGLFLPLRRRVQDFIDRRFFRKKYNAAKVIADFAATARDETDLDTLTARLVEVVGETMQPESVTLWLKPMEKRAGVKPDDR
jgi:hypothetical protein